MSMNPRASSWQKLSIWKRFVKKGGFVRLPYKLLFPDQVSTRDVGNQGPKGIFLTGIHRSGTSWVSQVISQAEGIKYWREPFNPSNN
jgi:hypothetical protein